MLPDQANPGKYRWTRVIKNGFGDTWNQYGMTMQVFGKYLYVGTAVGAGMVRKNGEEVGTRPCEVIRIDKYDRAELVVGSYMAFDPIEGGPQPRIPLSGWPAGFANPGNIYVWHMAVYKGYLYLGTCDLIGVVLDTLASLPDIVKAPTIGQEPKNLPLIGDIPVSISGLTEIISRMSGTFGGGDMWKTKDGIQWTPVTLNGFNNSKNYGIRRILPIKDPSGWRDRYLAVGTANPFTGKPGGGCEVWMSKK